MKDSQRVPLAEKEQSEIYEPRLGAALWIVSDIKTFDLRYRYSLLQATK